MRKQSNGVTLIALAITIIVLLIIAGIGFYSGKETIQKAELEELKTNMLLIQAKAKEYVEVVDFKMGIGTEEQRNEKKEAAREEIYGEQGLKKIESSNVPNYVTDPNSCYEVTDETRQKWGLTKIEMGTSEKYFIQFNEKDVTVEIYNTKGYEGKYSLSEIEKIEN